MFQETEFIIENLQRPLIDIDINQSNSWVGITGYLESSHKSIPKFPFGTHIHFSDKSYDLPKELRNPLVRSINEKSALVLGASKQYDETDKTNVWIINSSGKVKIGFCTNGAVENVVITKDFIVVTYFDESACYGEGLEVYDFEGKLLFGYEELFGKESVEIFDCYASALVKENQIVFCPYTEFPLVLFDIEAKTQQVWKTPGIVRGFSAITKLDDKIYFHHSYKDKFGIYEWQIGNEKAQRIGEYSNYFVRGLPNGRFLARTDSGYTIISLQ
ncbi:MAG: hypothetical protein M3033_04570 [Acidobacteriota bacterium]|nr:hypothetical protein [Acidobacteriota bacterium]